MNQHNHESMSAVERKVLIISCFGHFMSHFNMLLFPALVIPLANYYDTDLSVIVGRSFWMYCFFGITALPWGIAADRWGARHLMMTFHVGAGLCCFSIAMFLDNLFLMSIFLAGLGIFSGIYHPTGLGWISRSVSRISIGMAINGIFGNLGLALSPLITGLLNWCFDIKAVFWFAGIINLLGIVLLIILTTESDKQKIASKKYNGQKMLKPFIILLMAMMLGGIAYRGATVILPAYFELKNQAIFNFFVQFSDQFSPNVIATITVSSVFIIGMVGQYTGGRIAEHFDLRKCYLCFHLITIPLAIIMAYVSNVLLLVTTMLYFFFLLGMQPIENTLVAKLSPPKFLHSAYGTKFILTFGVGALAVKMVSVIEKQMGMSPIFIALAFVSFILVLCILILIASSRTINDESKL